MSGSSREYFPSNIRVETLPSLVKTSPEKISQNLRVKSNLICTVYSCTYFANERHPRFARLHKQLTFTANLFSKLTEVFGKVSTILAGLF